jgi:hypothetical protein
MKPVGALVIALVLSACSAGSPSVNDSPTVNLAPSAASPTGTAVVPQISVKPASALSCSDLADAQRDSTEALSDVDTPKPDAAHLADLMTAVSRLMVKAVAEPSGDRYFDDAADTARAASTKVSAALKAPHANVPALLDQLKSVDADLSSADAECPG